MSLCNKNGGHFGVTLHKNKILFKKCPSNILTTRRCTFKFNQSFYNVYRKDELLN